MKKGGSTVDKDKAIDTTPIKEFVKYIHSLEDRIVALEEEGPEEAGPTKMTYDQWKEITSRQTYVKAKDVEQG